MASKILTVLPLLVLSGFFFAAEIVQAGVLFLIFACVMLALFVRAGAEDLRLRREEASKTAAQSEQPPGASGPPI